MNLRETLVTALRKLRQINWVLMTAVIVLCVVGIAFVYSACFIREDLPVQQLFVRQVAWFLSGLLLCLLISVTDYHRVTRQAGWIYLGAMALLVMVLLFGTVRYNARRWLFGVQPSEMAKLAIVFLLAARHGASGASGNLRAYLADLVLILVPVGLIIRQPDLGTALVFLPTAMIMLFVARVAPRAWWTCVLGGALVAGLLLGMILLAEKPGLPEPQRQRLHRATLLSPYQRGRILVYFFPERDPHGMAWNKWQSQIAVGSGGLWGKGFLQGNQNILGFLPRTVAPTDFIYAVIAEESGFVGSITVLLLFLIVIWNGLATAIVCADGEGRLLCVGVVSLLFMHLFVNVAMTIGLVPITGLPLPFVSYGGSFMWVMMAGIGLIQSVATHGRRNPAFNVSPGIPASFR